MDTATLMTSAVYLVTGVATTCLNQLLLYQGAGASHTMLIPLFNYLGLAAVAALPRSWVETTASDNPKTVDRKDKHPKQQSTTIPRLCGLTLTDSRFYVIVTALDLVGLLAIVAGINLAGSGLAQVIYASVTPCAALFRWVLLGKAMNWMQWLGVAVVAAGLACSAVGGTAVPDHVGQVLTGCACSLAGAVIFALDYVVAECKLSAPDAPSSRAVTVRIGMSATLLLSAYVSTVTVSHWDAWVLRAVEAAGGNVPTIAGAFLAMAASQLLHTVAYFKLLGSVGAVTTGILNALRAVCVFAVSAVLYCHNQSSQCFTSSRVLATVVVVTGVMVYSFGKQDAAAEQRDVGSKAAVKAITTGVLPVSTAPSPVVHDASSFGNGGDAVVAVDPNPV